MIQEHAKSLMFVHKRLEMTYSIGLCEGDTVIDPEKTNQALRDLQADSSHHSAVARLATVIDEVERTLALGVTHAKVVAVLNETGFDISLHAFNSALRRLRQPREQPRRASAVTTPQKTAPSKPPDPTTPDPVSQPTAPQRPLTPREAGQKLAAEVFAKPRPNPVLDALQRKRNVDENSDD